MMSIVKRCLDKEFKANEIDMSARVIESAWLHDKPIKYQIDLFYAGSRMVMRINMQAEYPFTPKVHPYNDIEPHKMIRLCEVIVEAFEELKRLTRDKEI